MASRKATVTMTLLGPGDQLCHRVLEMDDRRPSVVIGRSSKTPSKGLEASVYNAWFDSPVMSRMHARLELKLDDMTVQLEDLGSMHGTFTENKPLLKHQPINLGPETMVTFGNQVKRGAEVFYPSTWVVQVKSDHEEKEQITQTSQDQEVTSKWWEHSNGQTYAIEVDSDGSSEPALDCECVGLIRPDETCSTDVEKTTEMSSLHVPLSFPEVQNEAKATELATVDNFSYDFSNKETTSGEDMDDNFPTSLSEAEDGCDSDEDTSQHKLFSREASADIAEDGEASEQDVEVEIEVELSELSEIEDTYAMDDALETAFDSQDSEEVRCVIERAHDKSMLPHPTEVYLPSINLHDIVSDTPLPLSLGVLDVALADSAADISQDGADKEPGRITALTMGQRTGKHRYFQARERNKAEFRKSRQDTPTEAKATSSTPPWLSKTTEAEVTDVARPTCDSKAEASEELGIECEASPRTGGLDDKSKAMEVVTRQTAKRKIDSISEVPDEDSASLTAGDVVAAGSSGRPIRQDGRDDGRPTKKLKTFMNAAIKVSAGIAVGGASVFGILAATAPSFA